MSFKEIFCVDRVSPLFVILGAFIWIIDVAIIIFCIVKGLRHIRGNNKLTPFHRWSYWFVVCTFSWFLIILGSAVIACRSQNNTLIIVMVFIILMSAFVSQTSVLYQSIGRVYHTFKGSSYELTDRQYLRLRIHVFIICVFAISSFIFLMADELDRNRSIKPLEFKFFAAVCLITSMLYYWTISWRCVHLFSSKIMKIVVTAMTSVRDVTKIEENLVINSKQEKFLNTITKHLVLSSIKLSLTILGALALFTTAIFVLSVTLSNVATEAQRLKAGRLGFAIFGTIGLIDDGITVLCMFLHYQFANDVYKSWCFRCHNCAKRKWDKRAGHKMTQRVLSIHSKASMDTGLSSHHQEEDVEMETI